MLSSKVTPRIRKLRFFGFEFSSGVRERVFSILLLDSRAKVG